MNKTNKGITLIALVITIIILLILSGLTIAMLTGENGILRNAEKAREETIKSQVEEEIKIIFNEWLFEKVTGDKTLEDFLKDKVSKGELDKVTINEDGTLYVEKDDYVILIDKDGNIIGKLEKKGSYPRISNLKIVANADGSGENIVKNTVEEGNTIYINFNHMIDGGSTRVSPKIPFPVTENGSYDFVINGMVDNKTYTKIYSITVNQFKVPKMEETSIGAFIDYDAGTWKKEEIQSLMDKGLYAGGYYNTTNHYQFSGFQEGTDKNKSTNPLDWENRKSDYDGGWRILSFNEDKTVNIIHAGAPEVYFHPSETNAAFQTEYILSGGMRQTNYNTYQPRDWSMYENEYAIEGSAHCATFYEIKNIPDIPENFVNGYNTLKKIGAYYWTASFADHGYLFSIDFTGNQYATWGITLGIRPIITLKSNIQITGGKGTSESPYTIAFE